MPFKFPLDILLRFRRSVEIQRELRLQEANQRVTLVEQHIRQLESLKAELRTREIRELESGIRASELHFHGTCRNALSSREQELRQQLKAAEEIRNACLKDYRHARQERDVVDTLRNHQLAEYRGEESRREQRALDDMFLLRREFLRRG